MDLKSVLNLLRGYDLLHIEFNEHNSLYGHYVVFNTSTAIAKEINLLIPYDVVKISGDLSNGSFIITNIMYHVECPLDINVSMC